jgi:A/G-specific adenine glycosylase
MLQQTQIATVIPYYQRFLEAFPTISHLARAPLERVLELWSGLGYYRRARHLCQTAQVLTKRFAGEFPQDYSSLRALPGIGDYTAKAILSIAFNQPFAVLDGNVARVVARLGGLRGSLHQPQFRRAVETELARLLSRRQPGDFNQAMMELGQTLCLPRGPHCAACPLAPWCRGHQSGNPEAFPLPRPRRTAESHYLAVALLRRGGRVAMVRGLADGLLDDLWNFPAAFGRSPAEARASLREKLARLTRFPFAKAGARHPDSAGSDFSPDSVHRDIGLLKPETGGLPSLTLGEPLAEFRHSITFRAIQGRIYPVRYARAKARIPRLTDQNQRLCTQTFRHASLRWFELARLPQAAISQLARKILRKVLVAESLCC